MDEREKLIGLLKEQLKEELEPRMTEIEKNVAAKEEETAKYFEEHKEIKDWYDNMQGKEVNLKTNSAGEQKYIFKGFSMDVQRNLKAPCSEEVGKEVSNMIYKALTSSNTGAYAIPEEYGDALLGLAELQSYALSRCRVIRYPGNVMKLPSKGTRATVDAQAFGTANAAAATTLGQLTFTIDKRVGSYETIYNDVLRQANFDVIGEFVEPVMVEAIGQQFDDYMFNGSSEFTTNVTDDATSGATFSGAIGSSSITFSGLMDVEFAVEQERGLGNLEWVMPRGVFKYVAKLVDTNGQPIFNRDLTGATPYMIDGYPVYIAPAISATPADGAIAMAFGDPKHYVIGVNQELMFEVNPYILMKEAQTQFICHATADGNIDGATSWAYYKRSD